MSWLTIIWPLFQSFLKSQKNKLRRERYIMEKEFLYQILNSVSVSGYEEPLQCILKKEMIPFSDEVREDEMHNLICVLNPKSETRIMLSAHADEIGLMISNITEDGRIQVVDRGGIVVSTYPGQQVVIRAKEKEVFGVVEAYRGLFEKTGLTTKELRIDIGAKDREDAMNNVNPGDPVILDTRIRELANGRITARALDDRIGVYIIMEALKRAKEKGCGVGVYAASTTGEETTKTGAYWCSARIHPSLAVVVDVTYTSDCLGMDPAEMGKVELGKGPVLCHSPIVVKEQNAKLARIAEAAGIPVQWEVASRLSYTDADQIHFSNEGVPVVLVSIPLRYMHMPGEVADMSDVENAIELITEFLMAYQPQK